METVNFPFPWLELIEHPAFCVRNMKVVAVNAAAERLFISVGAEVSQMVTAHMAIKLTITNTKPSKV